MGAIRQLSLEGEGLLWRDSSLTFVYAGSENLFRILEDTESLRKREETIVNANDPSIDEV